MKKILFILSTAFLFASCDVETPIENNEAQLTQELSNDVSSTGLYKGVLSTLDSQTRASFEISIPDASNENVKSKNPKAFLTFEDGSVEVLTALNPQFAKTTIENLEFSNQNISFKFNVEENGENPSIIDLVIYNNAAEALLAKNTSRAPVTPITGQFGCVQCGNHPTFDTDITRTFNNLVIAPANGDPASLMTQVVFNGSTFNGTGTQTNCIVDSTDATLTNCEFTGMVTLGNGDIINWTGVHTFNNEDTTAGNDCSQVNGSWTWESTNYENLDGWFNSPTDCDPPIEIYFNNFNDFRGDGFSPTPNADQLDSDIVIIGGVRDDSGSVVNMSYGDTFTEATGHSRYAQGVSTDGGVAGGGIYSFRIGTTGGQRTLGVQPTGNDFTPGTMEFKILNDSGVDFSTIRLGYRLFVNNNGAADRSTSFNCSYSTDGTNFIAIPQLDYATPGTADTNGFVQNNFFRSFAANLPNGSFIYIRYTSDDVSGGGSRDEIGLDNLRVQGEE